MGGRERRSRADLWIPVAQLAGPRRLAYRSDRASIGRDSAQSEFAPFDRLGMERRRHSANEIAAVPRVLSVLRGGRPLVLPTVSTQRRYLSRCAVQYRFVRAFDAHDGAAKRS